jgi:hypothetical protein
MWVRYEGLRQVHFNRDTNLAGYEPVGSVLTPSKLSFFSTSQVQNSPQIRTAACIRPLNAYLLSPLPMSSINKRCGQSHGLDTAHELDLDTVNHTQSFIISLTSYFLSMSSHSGHFQEFGPTEERWHLQ